MTTEKPVWEKIASLQKELDKEFQNLNATVHGHVSDTFDDWLAFVINGWEIGGEGIKSWRYTKEQTRLFLRFYQKYMEAMVEALQVKPWHDFLGHIYENLVASSLRKSHAGQFFTPENVCDLMAKVTGKPADNIVFDPCCGSGRLPLAGWAASGKTCMVIAADLDRTCVMMTIVNLLSHGVCGTVAHADSLAGKTFATWDVNYPDPALEGFPHCRKTA